MRYSQILLYCVSIALTVFNMQILNAQIPTKDIITLSPNAAQLGAFGTVPVGLFTGTAQENIPIYEFKTKNLTLPITLNYSSNGLIVDKVASWVGFDWSLDAGGAITMTVKGYKDHTIKERVKVPKEIETSNAALKSFLIDNNRSAFDDFQPDVYSYNFLGNTGKFILDTDGTTVVTIPFKKMKISTYWGNEFVITTSDGVRYTFDEKEDFYCSYCAAQDQYPVTWYLTSIIHPAGDVIRFYYSKNSASFYSGISQQIAKFLWKDAPAEGSNCPEPENITKALGTTTQTAYLDSIKSTQAGTIVFQKSGNRSDYHDGKRLDRIIIKSMTNEIIRTVEFKYSYIAGNYNYSKGFPLNFTGIQGLYYDTEVNNRMFLDAVKFSDSKDAEVYNYSFGYINLDLLPSRLSFAQDHWGYFNGAYNSDFVPSGYTYWPQFNGIGGNRNPNGAFSRNGILQKITYPTGGYSILEYEPNSSGSTEIGGCRVKKIYTYTKDDSAPVIKKFFYNTKSDLSLSYGYFNMPYYNDYFTEYNSYTKIQEYQYETCHFGTLLSNSQSSIYYGSYGSVLYPAVTVSYGDNFEGGGEEHNFFVKNDTPANILTSSYGGGNVFPAEYSNDSWYTGTKSGETYFRKNSSGQLVNAKTISYEYDFDDKRNSTSYLCLAVTKRQTPDPIPILYEYLDDFDVVYYYLNSYWEQPVSTTVTEYDDTGNTFTTTTTYNYANSYHAQLTDEKTTDSRGQVINKKYYYPTDYSMSIESISSLINKYMIGKQIDTRTYNNNRLTSLEQYKYDINGQPTDYYNAEIEATSTDIPFNVMQPYTATHKESFSYDPDRNLVMVSSDDNLSTSYIWGYKNQYPVVKIEGLAYNDITSSIKTNISGRTFRNGSSYLEVKDDVDYLKGQLSNITSNNNYVVTIYTYKPSVGMTSQTDPNGITTYYEYDSFGRLKMIKDNEGRILKTYDYHYGQK